MPRDPALYRRDLPAATRSDGCRAVDTRVANILRVRATDWLIIYEKNQRVRHPYARRMTAINTVVARHRPQSSRDVLCIDEIRVPPCDIN